MQGKAEFLLKCQKPVAYYLHDLFMIFKSKSKTLEEK